MSINVLKKRLPDAYQEVEYIESTGTQYIDTGIKPENIGFELTMQLLTASGDQKFFGSYSSSGGMAVGTISNCWRIGDPWQTLYSIPATTNKTIISYHNGTWSFNGTTTEKTLTNYSGGNIVVFAVNYNNTVSNEGSFKVYGLKLYQSDVLVRDFVSCYRKSDNEIGLYDLVNGVFYTNAGTGTFTKGNNVNSYTTQKLKANILTDNVRLPSEYQEVEYIESTGYQYINTNVKGNAISSFELTTSTDKETNIGARNGVGTNAYLLYIRKRGNDVCYSVGNYAEIPTFAYDDINNVHTYKLGIDGNFYIDNVLKATFPSSSISLPNLNFYLLSFNNSNSPITGNSYGGKLYACKFYSGDNIINNFIPCYRKSDNVAGLYDMQNNQFYTNAGTGTFSVGNDVPDYIVQPVKINILKKTDNLFDEITTYTKTGFTISNGEISTNYNYLMHSFSQYGSNEFSLPESTKYYVSYKIKIACSNPSGNKSVWISFKNVGTSQNYAVTGYSVANFDEWTSISFNRTLPAGTYQVSLGAYGGPASETYTSTIKDIMFDTKQITAYEPYGYEIIKI